MINRFLLILTVLWGQTAWSDYLISAPTTIEVSYGVENSSSITISSNSADSDVYLDGSMLHRGGTPDWYKQNTYSGNSWFLTDLSFSIRGVLSLEP